MPHLTLVFCLEERSAKAMLEGLLPRLLPEEITLRYIVFEGKQDLEKRLEMRIKHWQTPHTRFVVLRDQDSGDCMAIKQQLVALCYQAGQPHSLVRIACRELESWYLGNLQAVETAFGLKNIAHQQSNRKYRNPDQLNNAAQELKLLTRQHYQKIAGSRKLGPLMIGQNTSVSFNHFISGVRRIAAED